MNINLSGQVALVTGAGRGIGKGIADLLVANGARVVYSDIDFDAAREGAGTSRLATPLRMDVTSADQVAEGMASVLQQFGRIDIVVNNAGVNSDVEHRVTFEKFSPQEWERILKIDLTGVFLVSRAAARIMIPCKSGSIVNISSVLGVVPARLQCAYTAAKAGVINFTRAMAIEMGPHNVVVNCVAPGTMSNVSWHDQTSPLNAKSKRLLSHVPLGRPGSFEDVANAVLFFTAAENRYVTGQTLCVDGGWSAGGFFRDF
ncbi:MAG TPA: SDR family NAD(P)-dependent oxidoreductase [Gemmatimonadaceae bacterium]|nr:SDR family NAD(P)-dependent oxidoreductase [Gemmatimonadaceae bacterium]